MYPGPGGGLESPTNNVSRDALTLTVQRPVTTLRSRIVDGDTSYDEPAELGGGRAWVPTNTKPCSRGLHGAESSASGVVGACRGPYTPWHNAMGLLVETSQAQRGKDTLLLNCERRDVL